MLMGLWPAPPHSPGQWSGPCSSWSRYLVGDGKLFRTYSSFVIPGPSSAFTSRENSDKKQQKHLLYSENHVLFGFFGWRLNFITFLGPLGPLVVTLSVCKYTPLLSWQINKNFDPRTGILHIVRDPQGIPKIPLTCSESSIWERY